MSRHNNILFGWISAWAKAKNIHDDPERRQRSVRFGVSSIVNAVIAVALSCLLFTIPFFFGGEGTLLLIFGIAVVAIGGLGALLCIANAIFYFSLQFYLNKKAIGWIAVVITIACIAAIGVVAYLSLSGM